MPMKYSIVIVTYNRQKELVQCLESIRKSPTSHSFEVVVVFNGDRTNIERFSRIYKDYSFHFIHKTTPAAARNFGVTKVRGEYLFFLDDDCTLPPDYFSHLNFDNGWDVLGGPDQTPKSASVFQKLTGEVLSSPLCMGPTYKRHTKTDRYSSDSSERELILCNLWMKTSLFHAEGFKFNADLFRNEENFLLKELKEKGKILHYSPKIYVYHLRKENLEKLGAAVIKSGECRVLNFVTLPNRKELIYFLPLVSFLSFLWLVFHPQSFLIFVFAVYALIVALYRAIIWKSFSFKYIFMHYFILGAYAIGLSKGLWKFGPLFYNNFKENRSFINESSSK